MMVPIAQSVLMELKENQFGQGKDKAMENTTVPEGSEMEVFPIKWVSFDENNFTHLPIVDKRKHPF